MLLATGPFLAELLVGTLLFSTRFRRRKHYYIRLTVSFFLEMTLGSLIYYLCYFSGLWLIRNTLCYLLLFALSLFSPLFCFDERPTTLVLCGVSGYMTQHIGAQILQMLRLWEPISGSDYRIEPARLVHIYLIEFITFVLISTVVYFLFARRTIHTTHSKSVERSMLWLSVTTLTVVLVLSSARDAFTEESYHLMLISRLLSIFCCTFLLYIRSDILEKSRLAQEREQLRLLYEQERKQYEQSRENIELINIKCHDLRHRIESWEQKQGQVPDNEIRELKHLIGIYDSTVKTGNDTLDTILTGHSLYCEKHGIRLSCMVDGNALSFLPVGDICSLFGNALENAIEAVSRLEHPEDRNISFLVKESRGMLVINIDNYFRNSPVFEDNLPKSTKGNNNWHGYGLKSIRRTAEQYGGEVTILTDEMFHLNILIPLPAKETAQL